MLTFLHDFPDNVVAVRASGEVTADDYQRLLVPGIEEKLSVHKRLRLLYVLGDEFTGFSGGAAWEDAKIGMRHFTHFERVAVVTDRDWVRHMVQGFGFALPGEVRVFETDDLDDAKAWIRRPNDPGELKFELDETRSLLVLEPQDELEAGDFERLSAVVDPYLEAHGALAGLVVVTRSFPGWDDMAALGAHLGFVRGHHRRIQRVALVTESHVLGAMPRVAGWFVHAELKRFSYEERDAAIAWATGAA